MKVEQAFPCSSGCRRQPVLEPPFANEGLAADLYFLLRSSRAMSYKGLSRHGQAFGCSAAKRFLAVGPVVAHDRTPSQTRQWLKAMARRAIDTEETRGPPQGLIRKWSSSTALSPTAGRGRETLCSPSLACRRANGAVYAPQMQIERLHERIKRRIKLKPSAIRAPPRLFSGRCFASGQIQMRKVDGWQTLSTKPPLITD